MTVDFFIVRAAMTEDEASVRFFDAHASVRARARTTALPSVTSIRTLTSSPMSIRDAPASILASTSARRRTVRDATSSLVDFAAAWNALPRRSRIM